MTGRAEQLAAQVREALEYYYARDAGPHQRRLIALALVGCGLIVVAVCVGVLFWIGVA